MAATTDFLHGLISMVLWSVTIIVTLKYVLLVMRADNDGEGGILALITLIRQQVVPEGTRTKLVLASLGVFGAALFFGDSMITPAISVLSAVEGLKVVEPASKRGPCRAPRLLSSACLCPSALARFGAGASSGP